MILLASTPCGSAYSGEERVLHAGRDHSQAPHPSLDYQNRLCSVNMSEIHNKLAKILRAKPEVLLDLERKMEKLTGKSGVMERIVEENETLVGQTLKEMGLPENNQSAKDIHNALIGYIKNIDGRLYDFLDKPDLSKMSGKCGRLCETALALAKPKPGFFIKKDRAVKMLEKFPPQSMLDFFGCKTVAGLVDKKSLSSVFSALRFTQNTEWMHKFFDEAYNDLTADDFEEREVELKVLEPEWLDVAGKFLEKKYHNLSHLKELGVIFIIPIQINTPGETLRMFTLLLHYLNEVPFYSGLFRKFSKEQDFADKVKSLLRGDVPEEKLSDSENIAVRIVQRYLAKDDPNDFRLMEPHINPEAEHWYKAEGDFAKLDDVSSFAKASDGRVFALWQKLDFVGGFFPNGLTGAGNEELVSFDLIDLTMSLAKKGEIKYLYHQQEALWNKIFIGYFGREKMNKLIEENIINGYIVLK